MPWVLVLLPGCSCWCWCWCWCLGAGVVLGDCCVLVALVHEAERERLSQSAPLVPGVTRKRRIFVKLVKTAAIMVATVLPVHSPAVLASEGQGALASEGQGAAVPMRVRADASRGVMMSRSRR